MKKRIRKTGEIVDVVYYSCPYMDRDDMDCVSYIDSKGVEHPKMYGLNIYWDFDDVEEELTKEIDWEQRRYEIAKDVLPGLVVDEISGQYRQLAKAAILYADALIAELKKGENDE